MTERSREVAAVAIALLDAVRRSAARTELWETIRADLESAMNDTKAIVVESEGPQHALDQVTVRADAGRLVEASAVLLDVLTLTVAQRGGLPQDEILAIVRQSVIDMQDESAG